MLNADRGISDDRPAAQGVRNRGQAQAGSPDMTDFANPEAVKDFNKSIVDEFRANGGTVTGPFTQAALLLLTTTGAKSGRSRVSPLAYFHIDDKLIVIGSFHGASANPNWVHNLRANPRAHVEVGPDAFDVTAREVPHAEREELFPKLTAVAPVIAESQSKTSRVIPLFELQRA
jgi:deazaflavin-dependent oxidoreductase (nitroreductase family)